MDTKNTATAAAPLLAFHGSEAIKEKYLARVCAHRAADEIRQGYGYWKPDAEGQFRGCAVGCTLHSSDHGAYERELGIPQLLARLEDRLFEGMPAEQALEWPAQFLNAITPGADLRLVWPKFMLWLLADATDGVIKSAKKEATKAAISGVAALFQRWLDGSMPPASEWESARRIAADAAAYAAAYARRKHYGRMATKILELLREAK
jgi:hypothetical protein